MTPDEIIAILKENYDRNLRKQLVKSMLEDEKSADTQIPIASYNLINQIFSYVLKSLNWDIANNATQWNDQPLKVMQEVFPNIETTDWFKDKNLATDKNINVLLNDAN